MKDIVVLFTCFNRASKTLNVVKKISKENHKITFLVVDDNSSDDTVKLLEQEKGLDIKIIRTNGDCYYTGSMRIGMDFLIKNNFKYDYLLMINDDVDFFSGFLSKIINYSEEKKSVIVGCTYDNNKKLSYGGINYLNKFTNKVNIIEPGLNIECQTFNANCVLLPYYIFKDVGVYDKHYTHSMGDFDYGFKIRRKGYKIFVSNEYVGICDRNSAINTWKDKNLSVSRRLKKKEHPKGLPFKENFYYFYSNFNLLLAVRCSITPYLRIILKR